MRRTKQNGVSKKGILFGEYCTCGQRVVSVETTDEKDAYSIFPNPTNGLVSPPFLKNKNVRVFNSLGQNVPVLISKENKSLNLGNVEGGVYFLVIEGKNKNIIRKVFKE